MVLPAACVHKLVLRLQTVWSNQNKTNRSLNKQWLTSICSQRPFTICCLPVPKTWYQRKMDGWFEHHVVKATCVCVWSPCINKFYYLDFIIMFSMFYLFSTSNSYTAHGQLKRQKDLFVKLKNMEIMRTTKPDWRLVTMQAMLKQIGLKITNWYVPQWNVK